MRCRQPVLSYLTSRRGRCCDWPATVCQRATDDGLSAIGMGLQVFKMDWALNGPIPWKAQACRRAATVHLGVHCLKLPPPSTPPARGNIPRRPT